MINSRINLDALAFALGTTRAKLDERLDGRAFGLLSEIPVADALGLELAPKCMPYDATDDEGARYEFRTLTTRVQFAPSSCVGTGRVFDEGKFRAKVESVAAFVVVDRREESGSHSVWVVPSERVAGWYQAGKLGKSASVGRRRFLRLVAA